MYPLKMTANLIDVTANILYQNTFCFDTNSLNHVEIPIPIVDATFGILTFKAVTSSETTSEIELLFKVDCSGSMEETCSDTNSKMYHIVNTLKNMITFFHERPTIKANITVDAFDSDNYEIITRTQITDDNINEIMDKIEKIIPRGSTNIESALENSLEKIGNLKKIYSKHTICHIFMTDGQATDGSTQLTRLKELIDEEVENTFVGFGLKHDSVLLNELGSMTKSSYYFIDQIESAGLVYGEILHRIVYKLLTEPVIYIENGLIYNFKTNTWNSSLLIDDIVSEANKTFNIIALHKDDCLVTVKGTMDDLVILFPATRSEDCDLSTHIYRQKTLQVLCEVKTFFNKKRSEKYIETTVDNVYALPNETYIPLKTKKALKIKLIKLIEEIKTYMNANGAEDNKLLKNLCDDIYICYKTFETDYGLLFCTSRMTSQGAQRNYTPSHIENISGGRMRGSPTGGGFALPNSFTPEVLRQMSKFEFDEIEANDLQSIRHNVSDFTDTPYLSNQAHKMMRDMSQI